MWPLTHSLLHRNHSHMEQSFRGHLDVPEAGDGLNLGVPGLCEECKKKKCVCKHDGGVDSLARRPQKPVAFTLRPLVHQSGHREQADYGRQGTELSTGERHRCVMGGLGERRFWKVDWRSGGFGSLSESETKDGSPVTVLSRTGGQGQERWRARLQERYRVLGTEACPRRPPCPSEHLPTGALRGPAPCKGLSLPP